MREETRGRYGLLRHGGPATLAVVSDPPLCPSCTQPAVRLADGWHCRNEACPEYGQALQDGEPPPDEPAAPGLPGAGA